MSRRIQPDRVLEHPFRKALHDAIRREPGIAFLTLYHRFRKDAAHAPGLGFGSLGHHLDLLVDSGLITTRKSGRHRRHYENGGDWNGDTTALAVAQARSVAFVCRVIATDPGLNQFALWQRMASQRPCTRQSVSYHLHRLERHGLVHVVRKGPARLYHPTDLLLRLLPYVHDANAEAQSMPAPTLVVPTLALLEVPA